MMDENKVGHLLKGVAEDVYNFLIAKESLSSVSDVIRHCRTFESLKMRRIMPKFGRLANITLAASKDTSACFNLPSTIQQIVRKELKRCEEVSCVTSERHGAYTPSEPSAMPVSTSWHPAVSTAAVEYSTMPESRVTACYPASHSVRPAQRPHSRLPLPRCDLCGEAIHHAAKNKAFEYIEEPPRRSLPVYYSCGVTGHISHFCNRRRTLRYDRPLSQRPQGAPQSAHLPYGDSYWPSSFRNRSPGSDRSLAPPLHPHAPGSPSPLRHRSSFPSPPEELASASDGGEVAVELQLSETPLVVMLKNKVCVFIVNVPALCFNGTKHHSFVE